MGASWEGCDGCVRVDTRALGWDGSATSGRMGRSKHCDETYGWACAPCLKQRDCYVEEFPLVMAAVHLLERDQHHLEKQMILSKRAANPRLPGNISHRAWRARAASFVLHICCRKRADVHSTCDTELLLRTLEELRSAQ
jgi:hypothetical protein